MEDHPISATSPDVIVRRKAAQPAAALSFAEIDRRFQLTPGRRDLLRLLLELGDNAKTYKQIDHLMPLEHQRNRQDGNVKLMYKLGLVDRVPNPDPVQRGRHAKSGPSWLYKISPLGKDYALYILDKIKNDQARIVALKHERQGFLITTRNLGAAMKIVQAACDYAETRHDTKHPGLINPATEAASAELEKVLIDAVRAFKKAPR